MTQSDLASRRRASGLTQAELARRSGVPQPNISAYERHRRTPSPEVAARLHDAMRPTLHDLRTRHREEVLRLVAAHHAAHPRVVGSAARGEEVDGSDIDLLVEFTDAASLLDEVGLRLALQDLLEIEVDVIGSDSLRGAVRERVLRDAVPL